MAKLNNISEPVKIRVLKLYLVRMKLYYTVKMLKWFLLNRSDNYEDVMEVKELMERIEKRAK